ncbi:class I SAM-dependent methyltransferase [Microbacterium sp. ASV81]|uniref:Methyltransferase n=1 Tax=Microbacterium capsulatum TaxID=3041921 RepID=A0ABU0XJ27_9MICO|nr:methyltransferase [Microbacterium sp. ASV81]MDQ4215132.1 methyltransferase [Microbacterium sp. ASV81]
MPDFPYARLRRFPDVEAPNLQAWDATDEILAAHAITHATERGVPGSDIAVIGDGFGALTLALTAAGLSGVRVHQDLVTGRRALAHNAAALGLDGFGPAPGSAPGSAPSWENGEPRGVSVSPPPGHADTDPDALRFPTEPAPFAGHELDRTLLDGARLVVLQLPKGLAELEEIADAVARWATPGVVVAAGGRVKHMTLAQNEVLGRYFGRVQPQRAERKSRVILAADPRPVPSHPPFPVCSTHADIARAWPALTLCAHGAAFAGDRIDIGTRVLLEELSDRAADLAVLSERMRREHPGPFTALDLGCGTGALAAAFALAHPDARILATDRSAAAVRSARATMAANGVAGRAAVSLDDAGSELPAGSVDLVLLNPPFHLGVSVHEGAGRRLIDAAARLLRPGGEVWTVFNSHLDHRRALVSAVGETEQLRRTPKFTVTRSVRA